MEINAINSGTMARHKFNQFNERRLTINRFENTSSIPEILQIGLIGDQPLSTSVNDETLKAKTFRLQAIRTNMKKLSVLFSKESMNTDLSFDIHQNSILMGQLRVSRQYAGMSLNR